MRYAIVASGGKQYRAVEGQELDVDRLAAEPGAEVKLESILLMVDGEEFAVGTPTVSGFEVKATVVDHISGKKVTRFRYSPKKRIRVRGGHRQQYTRLRIDFVGGKGETRKAARPEPQAEAAQIGAEGSAQAEPKAAKPAARKAAEKKTAAKKAAPTSKVAAKKSTK
jgi:large subunit ribosomal protein L21